MKIHSKFKDYYDSVMGYGVDDHVHWVRNTSEITIGGPDPARRMLGNNCNKVKVDLIPEHTFIGTEMYAERPNTAQGVPFAHRVRYSQKNEPDRENVFIGFCGKIYFGVRFQWEGKREWDDPIVRVAFSVEDIIKIYREYDKKYKTVNAEWFIKNDDTSPSWSTRYRFNKKMMTAYFKKYENVESVNFFVDLDTPTFAIKTDSDGYATIEINPVLTDLQFQKVMDPYTAYQEIEMYMGGVLAQLDEINVPGVSDEDLKTGKGFDKWSFKTMPTKNRGKK